MPTRDEQIRGIVSDMADAGFSESEINSTLEESGLIAYENPLARPASESALDVVSTVGIPAGMGALGRRAGIKLAAKYAPKAIRGVLPFLGSVVGEGAGGFATGIMQGQDPMEALQTGGLTAATGGLTELATSGLGRGLLASSGVPSEARREIARKPSLALRRAPGGLEEARLGQKVLADLRIEPVQAESMINHVKDWTMIPEKQWDATASKGMAGLRSLEAQMGTGGKIETEIRRLATRRTLTQEESVRMKDLGWILAAAAGGYSGWQIKGAVMAAAVPIFKRPLGKGLMAGSQLAGRVSAGTAAWLLTEESRERQQTQDRRLWNERRLTPEEREAL